MDNQEIKYWIALKFVDGVGAGSIRNLLDACGSPRQVLSTPLESLKKIPGIGAKTAARISSFKDWQKVEKELQTAEQYGARIITCQCPDYPNNLLNIYDYPPILYVKGDLNADDIFVAVVGSRMASTYGRYTTERMSRELALNGITVVSGMARGIDSYAHRGALAAKGKTVAVLGCGLDVIYPPENEKLYSDICACGGAVISEYHFGTPPSGPNFPARNRIISGISLGVVVVEATDKSGSLITARIALEQGREVFAIPGSIDSSGSKGTNRLIKEGAKLVENVDDIIDEIAPQISANSLFHGQREKRQEAKSLHTEVKSNRKTDNLNESELLVHGLLSTTPVDIDTLINRSGLPAGEMLSTLMNLELKDHIRQMPGKMFLRKE